MRDPENGSETYQRIYDVVRCIPEGEVATYGQIANVVERRFAPSVPTGDAGLSL